VEEGAIGIPNAVFISDTIPTSMIAGNTYTASVTMTNNGQTTWKTDVANGDISALCGRTGDANLFTFNDSDDRLNQNPNIWEINLPSSISVNPGETYIFTFTIQAPTTAGTYNPILQMLWYNKKWFGTQVTKTITVI